MTLDPFLVTGVKALINELMSSPIISAACNNLSKAYQTEKFNWSTLVVCYKKGNGRDKLYEAFTRFLNVLSNYSDELYDDLMRKPRFSTFITYLSDRGINRAEFSKYISEGLNETDFYMVYCNVLRVFVNGEDEEGIRPVDISMILGLEKSSRPILSLLFILHIAIRIVKRNYNPKLYELTDHIVEAFRYVGSREI